METENANIDEMAQSICKAVIEIADGMGGHADAVAIAWDENVACSGIREDVLEASRRMMTKYIEGLRDPYARRLVENQFPLDQLQKIIEP